MMERSDERSPTSLQVGPYRDSLLMAGPMSISEPYLFSSPSPVTEPLPNGFPSSLKGKLPDDGHRERRNSEGEGFPRMQGKHKIGHRRVDQEGNISYKRVPSSKLMQSIQEGIRHSVGKLASEPERDVLFTDFENTEIVFHPEAGTKFTPAHNFGDFHFKTYAPIAFRHFREVFDISPEDYMMSICVEGLIEISNPGASGSLFYLTEDEMFIIKTVDHSEAGFLLKLLPQYYMNIVQNPRTLLPKFFGLYCYKAFGKNVRIIVMDNLLPRRIKYHHKFDLKGSTYNRFASEKEKEKAVPTLKDVDFLHLYADGIYLDNETYLQLMSLFKRDCLVLQSFKIMDYSLLLGIHNLDQDVRDEREGKETGVATESPNEEGSKGLGRTRSINRHRLAAMPRNNNPDTPPETELQGEEAFVRQQSAVSQMNDDELNALLLRANIDPNVTGGSLMARTKKGERLLIFIGIIDILQHWRLRKKLEHAFKSVIHDGSTISVCHPTAYAKRYQEFMAEKVFHPFAIAGNAFKLANIPLRLSSRNTGSLPIPGSLAALQHRGSLSRTSIPSSISPLHFGRSSGSMVRGGGSGPMLPPDIVASAANGAATDASSSAGYPSHPPSGSASPHAYRKVRLTALARGLLLREGHSQPVEGLSVENVLISVADLQEVVSAYDVVRQRSESIRSSVSSNPAYPITRNGPLRGSISNSPKLPNEGIKLRPDGDTNLLLSEGTQTGGASLRSILHEPQYEETDL
ncbi:hypothetical protein RvY_03404 [Ramazzottius varieornatus]|uniref:PIPK domain-containing protein n=1 Tax=Ramazzottius varieornatus TaxID=947166 RepID=A0A1D1UTP6_RAMVA|nr:hypothetical protein RvY_03404 [Ramazzottius varieornatus]